LNGHIVWKVMALLLVLKLVSVAVSYASGNAAFGVEIDRVIASRSPR